MIKSKRSEADSVININTHQFGGICLQVRHPILIFLTIVEEQP